VSLQMDWTNKQIQILSPQTDILVQDLVDFIRTEEAGNTGIAFNQIVQASGKDSLGGVVSTGITCNLLDDWQLKFWSGSYVATISGGNLIGGIAGDPVAYTPGVQVVIIQSAASTIVISGSGITQQDKDDIIDGVWDEQLSGHTLVGSTGEALDGAGGGSIPTPEQVASAVWDEPLGSHIDAGSSSEILKAKANSAEIPTTSEIADAIWQRVITGTTTAEDFMLELRRLTGNDVTKSGDIITIYEENGTTPWRQYDLANGGRVLV
jgi:hypothetical protein